MVFHKLILHLLQQNNTIFINLINLIIMPIADIDFEGDYKPQPTVNVTKGTGNPEPNSVVDDDATALNHTPDTTDLSKTEGNPPDTNNGDKDKSDNNNSNNNQQPTATTSSTGELAEGDTIEFEGATYTIDNTGNLVDSEGKVFKQASEVKAWIESLEVDNHSDNELNINNVREALGIEIVDEEGKNVEFTNDVQGIKAYVDAVFDIKSQELQQAAINKLFADNPILKQFADYVSVNGTAKGFGDIPDRSGIQLDKDNPAQLEAIIRMAAEEFGNKSLNDSYIAYLRDSGALYNVAKEQLDALVEKDKQVRKNYEEQAKQKQAQDYEDTKRYWESIKTAIDNRVINGFKIPESFTKEIDGKKLVLTPNDFYDYLSRATVTLKDGSKISGYQADLNKLTDEEYRNRELLDAWLMFTGGSYKDLISMMANENKVKTLKLKAKEQNATKSIKVIRKQAGKVDFNDIVLS